MDVVGVLGAFTTVDTVGTMNDLPDTERLLIPLTFLVYLPYSFVDVFDTHLEVEPPACPQSFLPLAESFCHEAYSEVRIKCLFVGNVRPRRAMNLHQSS